MGEGEASVASSAPDQRHLRLIAASAQANEARVRDILTEEPWTTNGDHDALRQALQKAAARGKLSLVQLLLQHGADANTRRDGEVSALVKAADAGHVAVVLELLAQEADPNWRNRNGQTALFSSSMRGHNQVVKALLEGGANVKARDKEGRTALSFLASEKPGKWNLETLKLLLENGADVEVRDQVERTPLLWAATAGNVQLANILLEYGANIAAANNRGRTALHLASESNHQDLVELLLRRGADVSATSDGGWTALHNAAQRGNTPIVSLLLDANANVNAELSNGMTALHWAAFSGHEEVVKLMLDKANPNLAIKDSFDRTPMLCAAEKYHAEIVQLLSPTRAAARLPQVAQDACKKFEATVVDFGTFRHEKKQIVFKHSVHELLYGWDEENDRPKVPTLTKFIKYQPDFRWIHLPANNIAWVETLLAKTFIEGGHRDIEAFKALEKCFDQEHRGPLAHANFMRTFCQRISAPQSHVTDNNEKQMQPVCEEQFEVSSLPKSSQTGGESTPKKVQDLGDNGTPKPDAKKGKSEQIAERHPKRAKRAKGPPGKPSEASRSSSSLAMRENLKFSPASGKIVLFMPFLHYETEDRRKKMSRAIYNARSGHANPSATMSPDSVLMDAYLDNTQRLHPRRTLDQFFYHGIDTSQRDTDQVVSRYCQHQKIETKVFMVDQLWLWVLGRDLIITCFPQRWEQPKQDPLNVLDGIIEETNAKTRPPIQSVYGLAMLITSRCSGMFDRHRLDAQNLQFLDMFESSIGTVTDRESQLFSNFNSASAQSAQWTRRSRQRPKVPNVSSDQMAGEDHMYPDALLDISVETSLLAEIKDIRDELNILGVIIDSQLHVLSEFEGCIIGELRTEGSRRSTEGIIFEIKKRSREQWRLLEVHQKDINRMDQQAQSIYMSLTHLLDLKQKHSNALEARFASVQAEIAARQGQTIMVFTIVTIIFLPMSFIAAFFAINFQEWNGDRSLTIGYVSKYMFGIGIGISLPLIAMAFTVTDISDALREWGGRAKQWLSRPKQRANRNDTNGDDIVENREIFSSKERPSLYHDGLSGRTHGENMASPPPRISVNYEFENHHIPRSRLSPVSGRAPYRTRGYSGGSGSGNAVSWARPSSFDRHRGHTSNADLEMGTIPSSARRYS